MAKGLAEHFWVIPGKLGGGPHPARRGDLAMQLGALATLGYGAVLTLTETGLDPAALDGAGLAGLHLPITDSAAPRHDQMERAGRFYRSCQADGRALFVHCFAGYGRTGVVLAGLLIAAGSEPEDAIARVRRLRPGAIESARQEEFLLGLASGNGD